MASVAENTYINRATGPIDLFNRASRLWTHAEAILSVTKHPHVNYHVIKTSPTFAAIWKHVYEAGAAAAEERFLAEVEQADAQIVRLEAEELRLRAELRAAGIDPEAVLARSHERRVSPPALAEPASVARPAVVVDLEDIPVFGDLVDAVAAQVTLNCLSFAIHDREITEPTTLWPEVIRRPVREHTNQVLVKVTGDAIRGNVVAFPDASLEEFLTRFTRRILRLDGELWGTAAFAIESGGWKGADNPVAYVRTVAQREHRRVIGFRNPSRSRDAFALSAVDSLDQILADDVYASLIPAGADPYAEIEGRIDLELAIRNSALSAHAELALRAQWDGISRREAPVILGISQAEAEAAWKAFQRARPRLREHLSA